MMSIVSYSVNHCGAVSAELENSIVMSLVTGSKGLMLIAAAAEAVLHQILVNCLSVV